MNKKIIWALIALFVASNLATLVYFLNYQKKEMVGPEQPMAQEQDENPAVSDSGSDTITENNLKIEWLSAPQAIEMPGASNSLDGEIKFYRAGKAVSGKYKGADLIVALYQMMGDNVIRAVYQEGKFIILSQQSGTVDNGDNQTIIKDASVDDVSVVSDLKMPSGIKVPETKGKLILQGQSLDALGEYTEMKEAYKLEDGTIIYSKLGGNFLLRAKDGTLFEYYLQLDFLPKNLDEPQNSRAPKLMSFRLAAGGDIAREYTFYGGGCGNALDIVVLASEDSKEFGINSEGAVFYELKDSNFTLPEHDTPLLKEIYDSYFPGYDAEAGMEKAKISFEEFLADHPIIFWQDALGRWIQFKASLYQPAVECGKPVIYLYPEETTDVNVKVSPAGGFTKTEPAYKSGWLVKAEPNGDIYNYDDKKNYPYLFWEGYALGYDQPKTGFVAASSNIEYFLRDKLTKQGLIGREVNEFIEFWAPKMKSAPYYFITFVPQVGFDKLAPLEISPKPDTVIRVFMDYTPLERPMRVKEQVLEAPARIGFTVVEWGGALHK